MAYWQWLFRSKAVYNCMTSVGVLFVDDHIRKYYSLGLPDSEYRLLFISFAFVFGLG